MPLTKQAERERGKRRRRDAQIERLRAELAAFTKAPDLDLPDDPVDLADAGDVIAEWTERTLIVPTGRLAGQPFRLDGWQIDFLREAFAPGQRECALCCGRKNGKSGLIAASGLCFLCGPCNRPNWRAVCVSLTGALAGELRRQIVEISAASGLDESIRDYRSPTPGRIIGQRGAEISFLASDRATGNALGADLTLTDESGLMPESQRPVWDAVYSCVSGRDGRNVHISIKGDGPMFSELLERRGQPGIVIHEYAAAAGADLADVAEWHKANPGLRSGIKSMDYMRDASERAAQTGAAAAGFRVLDLNIPESPTAATVVSMADYARCVADVLPERAGECYVALDCGGATSFTGAAAFWPLTGRCEVYAGIGDDPPLAERSRGDGVGDLYVRAFERGEIWTYSQRETPIDLFVTDLAARLDGVPVAALIADEYRAAKLRDGLDAAGLDEWAARLSIRPVRWKHATYDIDHFQTAVITGGVTFPETVILPAAIRDSKLEPDKQGNVRLTKGRYDGRVDVLMAAILAVSAGRRDAPDPDARPEYRGSMG